MSLDGKRWSPRLDALSLFHLVLFIVWLPWSRNGPVSDGLVPTEDNSAQALDENGHIIFRVVCVDGDGWVAGPGCRGVREGGREGGRGGEGGGGCKWVSGRR